MHALFFEVRPKAGHLAHYFDHVARLKPVLAQHDGLLFLDRYGALDDADLLLSHQLWDSEEAIIAWRKDATHRRSQSAGRQVHFSDYRIRVGARVLHWAAGEDVAAEPAATNADASHVVAFYGSAPLTDTGLTTFQSVNTAGKFIALATADNAEAAKTMLHDNLDAKGLDTAMVFAIRRDYGQFDRAEAPVD
ncbi:MAG: antibiotic biosynthesis monooxygenase family protein [Yoonia sp.]|uniref:antibiotic biosynthesis monooxygenase family protein n=1 Tax=Yoonia sp. TaxID=2212373 RepID=UPI003EF2650C